MSEPDIYVERCDSNCPFFGYPSNDRFHQSQPSSFHCFVVEQRGVIPTDRRFPRWCPLLEGPVTVAAFKRSAK